MSYFRFSIGNSTSRQIRNGFGRPISRNCQDLKIVRRFFPWREAQATKRERFSTRNSNACATKMSWTRSIRRMSRVRALSMSCLFIILRGRQCAKKTRWLMLSATMRKPFNWNRMRKRGWWSSAQWDGRARERRNRLPPMWKNGKCLLLLLPIVLKYGISILPTLFRK